MRTTRISKNLSGSCFQITKEVSTANTLLVHRRQRRRLPKRHATPKLVTKPPVSFAKLLGKDGALTAHENNKYHKEAVQAGKDFLACVRYLENDVANQICSQRL